MSTSLGREEALPLAQEADAPAEVGARAEAAVRPPPGTKLAVVAVEEAGRKGPTASLTPAAEAR